MIECQQMSETLVFLQNPDAEKAHATMETAMIAKPWKDVDPVENRFWRAGNEIIAKNLMGTGALNAMLPGQHVTAMFGFCDIRGFGELTDVKVMPFVNLLAGIVHNNVPNTKVHQIKYCL